MIRFIFYSLLIALTVWNMYLIRTMSYYPFTSTNMRYAYLSGCLLEEKQLTNESIAYCSKAADLFKEALNEEAEEKVSH